MPTNNVLQNLEKVFYKKAIHQPFSIRVFLWHDPPGANTAKCRNGTNIRVTSPTFRSGADEKNGEPLTIFIQGS